MFLSWLLLRELMGMERVGNGKKPDRRAEVEVFSRHRPYTAILSVREVTSLWKEVGKGHQPAVIWARVMVKEENN